MCVQINPKSNLKDLVINRDTLEDVVGNDILEGREVDGRDFGVVRARGVELGLALVLPPDAHGKLALLGAAGHEVRADVLDKALARALPAELDGALPLREGERALLDGGPVVLRVGLEGLGLDLEALHEGVDLEAASGSSVFAVADGTVSECGYDEAYGYTVVLDHEGGVQTRYAHLSEYHVALGDTVRQGQTIGLSGSSGWTTGPHLHLGVTKNGASVDPLAFLAAEDA